MADDVPFVWGAGGARLTSDEIAQRRKVADTLMQQGGDTGAFPVGTRGAGLWTQGIARAAKGVMGAIQSNDADKAAQANAADNKQMIAALLGQASGASPAAAVSSTPTATPAVASSALDPETSGYIKAAADKFGVDPAYLSRTAMIESGGRSDATNPSGAAGLFQFMPKTAKEYGLDNPLDPEDSAMAAAELASDNRDSLKSALGRDPTNAELYLAHQQGAGGAAALLANPDAPAAQVVGRQAVLQNGGTDGMTSGQFANQWLSKFGGGGGPSPAVAQVAAAQTDPAALPAASAPTQGFAVPSPAVAKVASGLSAVNPGVLRALTSPYADDATKKIASIVLQQQMTPKEVHSQQTDTSGNMFDTNALTGEKKVVLKAGEDPNSVREYEYYKKDIAPGQKPMDYATWSDHKARAAANNVTTNVDTRAESEMSKTVGKAQGEVIGEDIKAGSHASNKLRQLATLDEANKSGGDDISSGPFGKAILSGKQGLSELTGVDLKGVPESEVIQKVGFGLATNMVKAISNRPSQMEFGKALENVPGLLMSRQGRVAMTSILTQEANAEKDIGRLANHSENHADWQGIKDKYYEEHPLVSPFTGKPFGQDDIQILTKAGGAVALTASAPVSDTAIPHGAVVRLAQTPTPEMKAHFDEVFGTGAADRILGGGK